MKETKDKREKKLNFTVGKKILKVSVERKETGKVKKKKERKAKKFKRREKEKEI